MSAISLIEDRDGTNHRTAEITDCSILQCFRLSCRPPHAKVVKGGLIVRITISTYFNLHWMTNLIAILRKNSGVFCAILLPIFITACQLPGRLGDYAGSAPEANTTNDVQGRLLGKSADRARVARDLVSALRQIEGLEPSSTGLLMKTPRSPFGQALGQALIDSRYEMFLVDNPKGDNVLAYEIKPASDNTDAITIIVSVDRTRIKRDYRSVDGRTKPASSLFVLGANPDNIILDSAIFNDSSAQAGVQSAGDGSEDAVASVELPPLIDMPAISDNEAVSTSDTAPITSFAIRAGTTLKRKQNMYDIGESNFQEVLKSYQDVDRRVLVFGNDSMRLGSSNKWFVKTMAKKFQRNTDAFSVIGCSFGYSKIKNGNALLALGRAQRVKEELLRNGVPESNILDEGCWSGGENDRDLPSRGVLLVLKRRA